MPSDTAPQDAIVTLDEDKRRALEEQLSQIVGELGDPVATGRILAMAELDDPRNMRMRRRAKRPRPGFRLFGTQVLEVARILGSQKG